MRQDLNPELTQLNEKAYAVGAEQDRELDFKRREGLGDKDPGTVTWNV